VIVVPDAGPLIYLAGSGHLDLLPALYSQVVVPQIVFDEIVVAGAGLTGAREVEGANWLQVEDVPAEPSLLATLDRGEAVSLSNLRVLGHEIAVGHAHFLLDTPAREGAKVLPSASAGAV
jgi:predicted nucleic acid-binding protein